MAVIYDPVGDNDGGGGQHQERNFFGRQKQSLPGGGSSCVPARRPNGHQSSKSNINGSVTAIGPDMRAKAEKKTAPA